MKKLNTYNIEVTDTFGGEANYCWVRRYKFRAKTLRGAIQKLSREYGAGWRYNYGCSYQAQYMHLSACICCFVTLSED